MTARELAVRALFEVEQNGAYSDKALKSLLHGCGCSSAERALASELTYGVIRWKLRLDFCLQHYSSVKIKKLSVWILNILRCGLYQLFFLDKIPDNAAVSESVSLAKRYGHAASAGYVNAVLRAAAAGGEPKYTSLEAFYSHPAWLIGLLSAQYPDEYKKILAANNTVPTVTVRTNVLKTTTEALCARLLEKGIEARADGNMVEIAKFGDIAALDEYKEGLFTPQDRGAYLAAAAVSPQRGELIIDVCAAPGGKTTQLAEMSDDMAQIVAFDIHPHKIALIQKNAQRLGIASIKSICHDATQVHGDYIGRADRVLADVPCSGLGIIRKKPDIKWRKTPQDVADIIGVQRAILAASSQYVKAGGILVYSTCTVNRDENGGVVDAFLQSAPFEKLSERQLLPHIDGCDGFYICCMKRSCQGVSTQDEMSGF